MSCCPGPSVRKAGADRVVRRQHRVLLSVLDGWWAHVLTHADVMSEGAVTQERDGPRFYGTVSIRSALSTLPVAIAHLGPSEIARLALADPHARLRIVRMVHREVASRAPSPLGVVQIDLEIGAREVGSSAPPGEGAQPLGLLLDVRAEVQVAVQASPRSAKQAPRR